MMAVAGMEVCIVLGQVETNQLPDEAQQNPHHPLGRTPVPVPVVVPAGINPNSDIPDLLQ
jgi:hypothetical protein